MFVPILAYHKIQDQFELGVSFTTLGQFERQIAYLREQGYRTCSIADYIQNRCVGVKCVILTFDDAYTSVFENAYPILQKYGFTATLFVITRFVGQCNSWDYHLRRFRCKHCNWEQIQELQQAGWEIGSHTVSHPNLRLISRNRRWHEVRYSQEILQQQLGVECSVFSYPFGACDTEVIQMVRRAGYAAACTLGHSYPYDQEFPFALFRRGVYCFEPLNWFKAKLSNSYIAHCDDIKQKMITRTAQNAVFSRFLRSRQKLLDS